MSKAPCFCKAHAPYSKFIYVCLSILSISVINLEIFISWHKAALQTIHWLKINLFKYFLNHFVYNIDTLDPLQIPRIWNVQNKNLSFKNNAYLNGHQHCHVREYVVWPCVCVSLCVLSIPISGDVCTCMCRSLSLWCILLTFLHVHALNTQTHIHTGMHTHARSCALSLSLSLKVRKTFAPCNKLAAWEKQWIAFQFGENTGKIIAFNEKWKYPLSWSELV